MSSNSSGIYSKIKLHHYKARNKKKFLRKLDIVVGGVNPWPRMRTTVNSGMRRNLVK